MESLKQEKNISNFNDCMLGVITYIGNILPGSFFSQHLGEIQIVFKQEPTEPIAYFLEFIYAVDKFREGILNRDENVMMHETFEDTFDKTLSKGLIGKFDKKCENNPLDDVKKKYIKKIFDFKESWKYIKNEQKKIVQDIMITCVKICNKYVILQDKINKGANHNEPKKKKKPVKNKKKPSFDDISTSSLSSSGSSKSSKSMESNKSTKSAKSTKLLTKKTNHRD